MIVTISTDSNYVDQTLCLINSIKTNSPSVKIHLRAIDCTAAELNALRESYDKLILEDEQINLSTKRKYFRAGAVLSTNLTNTGPHRARLLSERQCYVSNTRYRNILHCLTKLKEDIVVLLDADTIVRKNLLELTDFINKYDVLCNVGNNVPRYPNNRCWECSCIIARNTVDSIAFFEKVKTLTESKMNDWDSDQFAIEQSYNPAELSLCEDISHIEDLSWRILTVENWDTISFEYSPDTYIWPGSGEAKFTRIYLNEQNKYRYYENMLPNR
jgi:hypothetical protein